MTRMRFRCGALRRPIRDGRSVLLSLVLVGCVVGSLVAGWASAATAAGEPRLLLLPVVVHSAEDPEYLRDGLSDMLASRFDRIGAIELVRAKEDSRGTTSLARALSLARKAGADYVLYGSFTRFGQGASLDVQCAPVSDAKQQEPLREIFVHSGSIGEIIPDLDELAGKVSRFARGEAIVPAAPLPGDGLGGGPGGALSAAAEVGDLEARVEALEAALTELLESSEETGIEVELR